MEAERNFDVRARAPDVDPSHVMLIWAVVHPEIAPGNRGDAQTATTGRWATPRQIPACISDQRISVVQDRSTKRGIPPCGISIGTQASRRPARPSEWHQQPRQAIWLFIKRQNILFMDLRLEASSPDPQPRCAREAFRPLPMTTACGCDFKWRQWRPPRRCHVRCGALRRRALRNAAHSEIINIHAVLGIIAENVSCSRLVRPRLSDSVEPRAEQGGGTL